MQLLVNTHSIKQQATMQTEQDMSLMGLCKGQEVGAELKDEEDRNLGRDELDSFGFSLDPCEKLAELKPHV